MPSRRSLDATALVIAHRLSAVVDADRIVVIEHGAVVEEVYHDLWKPMEYAELWRIQREQKT